MGLKVIIDDGRQDVVISTKRLWLTADRDEVVEDGDERAAFLLVGEGGSMDRRIARTWGLEPLSEKDLNQLAADAPVPVATKTEVGKMTLRELRVHADGIGVDSSMLKTKPQIIEAIEAYGVESAAAIEATQQPGEGGFPQLPGDHTGHAVDPRDA